MSKETYLYQKRSIYVKRVLCMPKDADKKKPIINAKWLTKPCDHMSKETYIGQSNTFLFLPIHQSNREFIDANICTFQKETYMGPKRPTKVKRDLHRPNKAVFTLFYVVRHVFF